MKKIFSTAMTFFGCNAWKCVSLNNQECKIRPQIININSNEPSFYHASTEENKCSDSCNNINNPYAKLCVPDIVKNINVKAFNLMTRTNEARHMEWHDTCKCKCRLDANVCNNNVGMMKNVDVNVKNWLTKEDMIKDLFGILVILMVKVINQVVLENI